MTPRLLVSALLVCLLLDHSLGISLPSIFGSRVTKEDTKKDTKKDTAKDDVPLEYQDHTKPKPEKEENPVTEKAPEKSTRPPLPFGIRHPADHPLHPHNRPNSPLHPDNLPHLPSLPSLPSLAELELPHLPALPPLPSLPHFTRETIHATKTVFIEVTDKVTVHPVCMTVYKVTPPCLPYNQHGWREGEAPEGAQERQGVEASIQPTAAPQLIAPTATAAAGDFLNLEPTRILGGEYVSEAAPAPSEPTDSSEDDPAEARDIDEEGERTGRWVRITPPIKVEETVKVKDDTPRDENSQNETPAENSGPLHMVQQLINRSPVTVVKTKTLCVTKVEKVLDTRVTATLIAKNCIPTNSHIPYCAPHGGLLGPGYHGGTFLEAVGGIIASGGWVDKVDGESPAQGAQQQAQEQNLNLVGEVPEVEAADPEAAEGLKVSAVPEDEKEAAVEEVETTERLEENKLPGNTDNEQVAA